MTESGDFIKTQEETIIIGGVKQNILTLSENDNNPVLLIVHGGPGSPDRPLVCKYNSELAERFVVVCWDQRCSGLSYTKESRREALSAELMLTDLKELTEYLLKKYHRPKIYLSGHSWGAYLGLWFASLYPEYLYYYIGTGQGISSKLDEIEKYKFVMTQAKKRNDNKIVNRLTLYGSPENGIYSKNCDEAKAFVGKLIHKYGGYINEHSKFSEREYLLLYLSYYKFNTAKVIGGINYSVKYLTPKMKENDIIPTIKHIDVPIKLIFGEKDYICPVATAKLWFDCLIAPQKDFVIIKNASHMVNFEQAEKWNEEILSCINTEKSH